MYETTPQQQSDLDRVIDVRTRAFAAVALGLVGVLGGGSIGTALGWLLFDYSLASVWMQTLPQAVVTAGFGMGAIGVALTAFTARDAVATPLVRVAILLGLIAGASAVLLVLATLLR